MPGAANHDQSSDAISREIMGYLARHPFTKFNRMALVGIFKPEETRRIDQALKKLLAQGLVAYQSNGSLYWLTPEEPAHSLLVAQFANRNTTQLSRRDALLQQKLSEIALV